MKSKKIIGGILAASVAAAAVLGGCSQISSNQTADMNQVLAEINVTNAAAIDKNLKEYADAVGTSKVIKRELVTYFINAGSNYINNYGWSYNQTFTYFMDQLVDNAVLVQYATLYLLKDKAARDNQSAATVISEYNSKPTKVEKYKYLLGEDSDDVKIATYTLMKAINNAIDRKEKKNDSSSSSGEGTRSTPSGVDTEKDNYYPKDKDGKLNYNVYTGYEKYLLSQSGAYKDDAVKGTSRVSRISAYIDFLDDLSSLGYNLVNKNEENIRDVLSLNYIQEELETQLEQRILNKYYNMFEAEKETELVNAGKGKYSYINSVYNDLLDYQKSAYATESAVSSALGNMSDSEFILYTPDTSDEGTFGYVYNILLPFSASQSARLTELQSLYKDEDLDGGYKPEYYIARNKLLKQITTTDQRSAWFNGENDYAFKADDYYKGEGASGWLFFENNITNPDSYEALSKYYGKYSYKGMVVEKEKDGGYILVPDKLTIDDMLKEFIGYVDYATGTSNSNFSKNANYYDLSKDTLYKDEDGDDKIDYNNFIYAKGKLDLEGSEAQIRASLLYTGEDNTYYNALSAVNELQYAYTTDTAVLSQYIGYSVDAGDTSYIKEFEYAAHEAIKGGAGSWAVCAGDYGWHLIYVTYTFDNTGVAQYTPDWEANVDKKGTFENLFYEMVKSKNISDISTTRSTQIIKEFKSDNTVTKWQSRYQDLLDIQN
ncbi:MAG: hypothetical protein K2K80_04990 [Clostridia bacterium]|nr:hypothetical protein [Clostridia bacterium]